jgi:hypothetical protein
MEERLPEMMTGGGARRPAGPGFGPGFGPGLTTPTTLPPRPPADGAGAEAIEPVEVKNYIWLALWGEAYQFSPVREKLESEAAKAAKAAGAGGTAP